jgi:hypothetical protein
MPRWYLLPLLLLSASVSAGELFTELAAKAGFASAQYTLGNHYFAGEEGYPQDYDRAAYWYLKAAKGDNVKGQLAIGIAYRRGQGVTEDIDAALYWMKKSAGNGTAWRCITSVLSTWIRPLVRPSAAMPPKRTHGSSSRVTMTALMPVRRAMSSPSSTPA